MSLDGLLSVNHRQQVESFQPPVSTTPRRGTPHDSEIGGNNHKLQNKLKTLSGKRTSHCQVQHNVASPPPRASGGLRKDMQTSDTFAGPLFASFYSQEECCFFANFTLKSFAGFLSITVPEVGLFLAFSLFQLPQKVRSGKIYRTFSKLHTNF